MFTYFIKFFHLLFALGLLGTMMALICSKNAHNLRPFYKLLAGLSIFALLTGTELVYATHFTFYTPWIKAAYLLVSVFIFGIYLLLIYPIKNKKSLQFIYLILIIFLLLITHDAVRKETFIF